MRESGKILPSLTDYIRVYERVIDPRLCDLLVEGYESHKEYAEFFPSDEYRYHRLDLYHTPDLHSYSNAILNLLQNTSRQYFAQVGADHMLMDDLTFGIPTIKKYEPDQTHTLVPHVDAGCADTAVRYLTMILYLTDNEQGATYFPQLDVRSPCKKGNIVIFPSTWQYQHMGEHAVKVPKYISMAQLHWDKA